MDFKEEPTTPSGDQPVRSRGDAVLRLLGCLFAVVGGAWAAFSGGCTVIVFAKTPVDDAYRDGIWLVGLISLLAGAVVLIIGVGMVLASGRRMKVTRAAKPTSTVHD